ncbi:MAG TPA: hypothetical protein VGM83_22275 [Devosiaceae bacterium]|jgi:hypothetical protein
MAQKFDVVIRGSTPLAALLAGLLASVHGRRIALASDGNAAFGLVRDIDLSAALFTRPATWELLQAATPETIRLIEKMGARTALGRCDAIFVAETEAGREVLGHFGHMSAGFGQIAERLSDGGFVPDAAALRLRDVTLINRSLLQPRMEAWLDQAGVVRSGGDLEATMVVLADDTAILAHGLVEPLGEIAMNSVLTEPLPPLRAPVLNFIDRAGLLMQRADRSVIGVGHGDIGATLAHGQVAHRAGESHFRGVFSRDGAPVIGPLAAGGPMVFAGLGTVGAFLAPVLARLIAGDATPAEQAWCLAHAPTANRAVIAEFVPGEPL